MDKCSNCRTETASGVCSACDNEYCVDCVSICDFCGCIVCGNCSSTTDNGETECKYCKGEPR